MTLTLKLPPELEHRLASEAKRKGVALEEYTLQVLQKHVPGTGGCQEAVSLLQSWIDEDDGAGQKETGEYLLRSLDQDRLSHRKLFPPELEGVTW